MPGGYIDPAPRQASGLAGFPQFSFPGHRGYADSVGDGPSLCCPSGSHHQLLRSLARFLSGTVHPGLRLPPLPPPLPCVRRDEDLRLDDPIEAREVHLAIAASSDTAPGMDGIPYAFLRHLPSEGVEALTRIFNIILDTGVVPPDWKNYLLLPFLKPAKPPELSSSYRPIALSSCVLKVFERVLKARLERWAETLGHFDPLQFGFRKGRNTSDALGVIACHALLGFAERQYTAVAFVDVAGAYDSVIPDVLLTCLQRQGIPPRLLRLLSALLRERNLYATYEGRLIGPRRASLGLAQGSVLSPLLYLLYTAEISVGLPVGVTALQFADDVTLLSRGPILADVVHRLQEGLETLAANLSRNGASLSPEKSAVCLITRRKVPDDAPPLHLHNVRIPLVPSARCLGLIFDSTLSWTAHSRDLRHRCAQRLAFMQSLAGTSWGAHPSLLRTLYVSVIRPLLDYGAGIYDPRTRTGWGPLERLQNRALRILLGAMPSTPVPSLHVESAIMPLRLRARYLLSCSIARWRSQPGHPAAFLASLLAGSARHRRYFARRPPLFIEVCVSASLPDVQPGPQRPWPCFSLSWCDWVRPLPVRLHFPPAPIVGPPEPHLLYRSARASYWRGRHILATDGSRSAAPVTVGAAFWDGPSGSSGLFRLPSLATVFLAEAVAILEALRYVARHGLSHASVLTDSLSVLTSLSSGRPSARTPGVLIEVRRLLCSLLDRGLDPELAWVPAHVGIEPNELVDYLANVARYAGRLVDVRLPPSSWDAANEDAIRADWRVQWSLTDIGRHLYHFCPHPPSSPWFLQSSGSRRVLTTICRLRLGHTHAPAHLHRCAGTLSPRCPCGEPRGTAGHILLECPLYDRSALRGVAFADLLASPSSVLIDAISGFLAANPGLLL